MAGCDDMLDKEAENMLSASLARKIICALIDYELVHVDKSPFRDRKIKGVVRRLRLWGTCYYRPKKQIVIYNHFSWADKFSTILHELLHAIYPNLSEEAIKQLTDRCSRDHLK